MLDYGYQYVNTEKVRKQHDNDSDYEAGRLPDTGYRITAAGDTSLPTEQRQ